MQLRAVPFYLVANYKFNRGNSASARKWLDRYFARETDPDTMALAQDAFLLTLDGHHARAKERFTECLEKVSPETSDIDQFLSGFCHFWLAVYEPKTTNDDLKERLMVAQKAPGTRRLKANFPLPKPETVDRIRDDGAAYPFRPSKSTLGESDISVTFNK